MSLNDNMLTYSLASARVNAKMKQSEVAELLNVSQNTIIAWENGKSEPKISQARQLSVLYHIPLDCIVF